MRQGSVVLIMCAGLLLSGGAILGGSVLWSLLRISYYFWLTDLAVELSGGVLLVAGALLCLPACWLATLVPYHPKSQSHLATLLCVTTAAMMVLSMGLLSAMALTHALRDPAALNASLREAMPMEGRSSAVRHAFAAMQCDLRCCGVQSYKDWKPYRTLLPASCCQRHNGRHTVECEAPAPATAAGCLAPALRDLRNYASAHAALSSTLIIILAVTVFAAAYSMATGSVERQKAQKMRVAFVTSDSGAALLSPGLLPPAPRSGFVSVP